MGGCAEILDWVAREVLSVDIRGSALVRRNLACKGLEARMCLGCPGIHRETGVAGAGGRKDTCLFASTARGPHHTAPCAW